MRKHTTSHKVQRKRHARRVYSKRKHTAMEISKHHTQEPITAILERKGWTWSQIYRRTR